METNVSRTVSRDGEAELLARARPFEKPGERVEGIGRLLPWAEFWKLTYEDCGHEQMFPRGPMNYDRDHAEREVRQYYATCDQCARDVGTFGQRI